MFKLAAKITVNSEKTWIIDKITACSIERDVNNITGRCTITLPKKIKWQNESLIPVRRGDVITVQLGYDDDLETVFTGKIKNVGVKAPIVVEAEDCMFDLKLAPAKKKSYASADLQTIMTDQTPAGIPFTVFPDATVNMSKYVVNADTVAGMIQELGERGIVAFFNLQRLMIGMADADPWQQTAFKLFKDGPGGNIIDDGSLDYKHAESVQLSIQAKGTDAAGKEIAVTVGDKEGEKRSFFRFNTTKQALEAEAKQKLAAGKISGLNGSFTTFGIHPVNLLERIKIQSGEHFGLYKVIAGNLSFDDQGYRQNITITSIS